jgi:primosomal protein N' (replication factor Y) (superfamily II helicase)
MKSKNILHIAIPIPLRRTFDYTLAEDIDIKTLKPGIRIKVPFGNRKLIGILLEISKTSNHPKLKPITEILDKDPTIDKSILNLCKWSSNYYHHPIGEVLFNALPKLLRQGKPAEFRKKKPNSNSKRENVTEKSIILNEAQQEAITAITKKIGKYQTFLLHGITGSGKTEVYLTVIKEILKKNQQALVLVPEIALTPQTIQRFEKRFDVPIVSFHSGLSDREKLNSWLQAKTGQAKIIIGTRSAIFTPFENLGIIIIDEEHDLSLKQQKGFRYSARDLAIIKANMENIPIILGSATPSFETLYNSEKKRYQKLLLPERAGEAIHPQFHIINIRDKKLQHGLSKNLLESIEHHLQQDNQVLIFLNRRGYAPILTCFACGWMASCPRCDVNMTLHSQPPHLRCHHCDTKHPLHRTCPNCNNKNLKNMGVGTEQLELTLKQCFPDVQTIRIDRDTTRRKNSLNEMLDQIQLGHKQILIGTQMLAKGHHFPNVTLVGVINADSGFFSADFRSTERIGQLLVQVAGRAGRAEKPGEILIQTCYPDHPLLSQLICEGYDGFAKTALQERADSQMPPYSYFALFRARAMKEEIPEQFLQAVKNLTASLQNKNITIFGPIPSPMPRKKGYYNFQLLLQSSNRASLQKLLDELTPKIEELKLSRKVKWSLDVDPLEMY